MFKCQTRPPEDTAKIGLNVRSDRIRGPVQIGIAVQVTLDFADAISQGNYLWLCDGDEVLCWLDDTTMVVTASFTITAIYNNCKGQLNKVCEPFHCHILLQNAKSTGHFSLVMPEHRRGFFDQLYVSHSNLLRPPTLTI
jgi:hypothetical protein